MGKKELREVLRNERKILSKSEKDLNAKAILTLLLPFIDKYQTVGLYLALPDEVNLNELLRLKKQFVVPVVIDDTEIKMCEYSNKHNLVEGKLHILEPSNQKEVDKSAIDTLIIPLVGFDEQLHRLGQGAGYYDRYLSDYSGLKIGVAFEVQKVDEIPHDEFDQDLDYIITEKQVYRKQ